MKRAELPVYTPIAPQRAVVRAPAIPAPVKCIEPPTPFARWPYRDIGEVVLSFPRDLRPHQE